MQKEVYHEEVEVFLTPVELALDKIESIRIPEISNRVPLDTSQKPIIVYGKTYLDYSRMLDNLTETISMGHTLRTKEVLGLRVNYSYNQFFISPQGWYENPREAFKVLLDSMRRLMIEIQKLDADVGKGITAKYNLKLLQSYVIADVLTLLESIVRESSNVSVNKDRDS